MPFQSEKQRRYLHANHPEIAKRWERDYAHGGILDINESKEIIDDGGNEIALTDYNAAFDDPNDLSTGVKSLFRAKKGGNVRLGPHTATDLLAKKNPDGTRSKYQPPGHRDAPAPSSDRGPRDAPDRFGPTTTTTTTSPGGDNYQDRIIEIQDRQRKADLKDIIARGDEEKYDTDLVGMTNTEKYLARRNAITSKYTGTSTQRKNALNKNYTREKERLEKELKKSLFLKGLKLVFGMPVGITDLVAVDWKNKSLKGPLKTAMTLDQLKKQHIEDLTDMKESLLVDVDINNPNEMANLDDTAFPDVMSELADLTKTREEDDTKGDGPTLPPQLGGPSTEEMAIEYGMSDLDRIRAGQAKRAMLVDKGIIQENPIVSGTEMDIIALGNSGGLANLFRVKKQ